MALPVGTQRSIPGKNRQTSYLAPIEGL